MALAADSKGPDFVTITRDSLRRHAKFEPATAKVEWPKVRFCRDFLAGKEHDATACGRPHVLAQDLPVCPAFQVGDCPYADHCSLRHVVTPIVYEGTNSKYAAVRVLARHVRDRPAVVVQVIPTHARRVCEVLEGVLRCHVHCVAMCKGGTKNSGQVVLATSVDPPTTLKQLLALEYLSNAVHRVYLVQHTCVDLSAAASYIRSQVDVSDTATSVRVTCYPKSDEREVVTHLVASGCPVAAHGFSRLASTVTVHGVVYVGVASASLFVGDMPAALRGVDAPTMVCRAGHKLSETFTRCNLKPGSDWTAFDVGAAPGGWSVHCARSCAKVWAVDPAELGPEAVSMTNIHHLKMTGDAAVLWLQQHAPATRIHLFLCDSNTMPQVALNTVMELAAAGLMTADAWVIITLKKFTPVLDEWYEAAAFTLRAVASMCCTTPTLIHLFANREDERTVVGQLSELAATAAAAFLAAHPPSSASSCATKRKGVAADDDATHKEPRT